MNSRLQQFLELENLTPARLADMLGVQRSGLSHILSGRNKPGYDFINKLLSKFPAISADWLLTGKGKPYKEMNNFSSQDAPTFPQPSPSNNPSNNQSYNEKRLINQSYNNKQLINQPYNSKQSSDQPILNTSEVFEGFGDDFDDDTLFSSVKINSNNTEYSTNITDNKNIIPENQSRQLNENQIKAHKQENALKKKRVKRVIIFYSDGSFEELFPQSL